MNSHQILHSGSSESMDQCLLLTPPVDLENPSCEITGEEELRDSISAFEIQVAALIER